MLYPLFLSCLDERRFRHALDEDEIRENGEGDASEDSHGVAQLLCIIKGEDNTRKPLHEHSREEGYRYADEDGDDDTQGLVAVEKVLKLKASVGIHLQQGEDERSAEQLEHERNRGGGWKTKGVEHVEHDDIGDHYGKENRHHLVERIVGGMHYAMSRHIHHSRTHHSTDDHAEGSDNHDGLVLCHLCSDGRVEEVYSVVADSHEEVEHCQDEQEDHDCKIKEFHIATFAIVFALQK